MKDKKNIVLIGISGSGKTTLGSLMAQQIGYLFVDLDSRIEESSCMSIVEIFDKFGEDHFRDLETDEIRKISDFSNAVIATGGGCVKRELNIDYLKQNGIILYLKSTVEQIYKNLQNDMSRPLLKANKRGAINDLMKERQHLYEKYSDLQIDVSGMCERDCVNKMTDALRPYLKFI